LIYIFFREIVNESMNIKDPTKHVYFIDCILVVKSNDRNISCTVYGIFVTSIVLFTYIRHISVGNNSSQTSAGVRNLNELIEK